MSTKMEIPAGNTITLKMIETWKKTDGRVKITSGMSMYKEPGKYRDESSDGHVFIQNKVNGKRFHIRQNQKKATLYEYVGYEAQPDYGNPLLVVNEYKTLPCEDLGEKELEDRRVRGYRHLSGNVNCSKMTWWVDIQTDLPVMIVNEWSDKNPLNPETNGDYTCVWRDMVFNAKLDDRLFDMAAPEGYFLRVDRKNWTPPECRDLPREEDLLLALRLYAEDHEGLFPPEFVQDVILDSETMISPLPEEKQARIAKLARGFDFVERLYWAGSDWHYAGRGIRLGQADKPIFWYRRADMEKYHVIFGDLRVQEVNQQDLSSTNS